MYVFWLLSSIVFAHESHPETPPAAETEVAAPQVKPESAPVDDPGYLGPFVFVDDHPLADVAGQERGLCEIPASGDSLDDMVVSAAPTTGKDALPRHVHVTCDGSDLSPRQKRRAERRAKRNNPT